MKIKPIEGIAVPITVQKEHELLWAIQEMKVHDVKTLLVIGSYHGGVEYHVARKYSEVGLKINITSIDPVECRQRRETANKIRVLGQGSSFIHGKSTDPTIQQMLEQYDAVFIDGDHSYLGAKRDSVLARKVAQKLIILHDVVDSEWHRKQGCFVSHVWDELKPWYNRWDVCAGTDWAGIGILYV
jgi:cephalosporin hydroxylase